MKCHKCGANINDGEAQCSLCGACENKGFGISGKKNPFRRKHIWIISIVAVLCIFFTSVCVSPLLRNLFLRLILSPKAYMCYVIKTNAEDFSADLSEFVGSARENVGSDIINDGSVEFVRSQKLLSIENHLLSYYLGDFDSVAVDYTAAKNHKDFSADVMLRLNGKDITDIQILADDTDDSRYIGLPDMSDNYMVYADQDSDGASEGEEKDSPVDNLLEFVFKKTVYDKYRDVLSVCPDKKELKTLLLRYAVAVFFEIDNVTETKSTCTADGISKEYIDLTLTVDEETVVNVGTKVIGMLKEDEKIKSVITDAQKLNPAKKGEAELYDRFYEALDNAEEELSRAQDGEILKDDIILNIRVNRRGEIKGISLSHDDTAVEYYVVSEGKKTAMYSRFKLLDADYEVEGSFADTDGKLLGEYVVESVGYENMNMNFSDVDAQLLNKGILSGKLDFDTKSLDTGLFGIKDVYSSCSIEVDARGTESTPLDADYSVTFRTKDKSELTFDGNVASCEASDIEFADENIKENAVGKKEWIENADFDFLYDKLRQAGIKEKVADIIKKLLDRNQ